MRTRKEYDPEDIDRKSKAFLKTIMGKDNFDKLEKYGKIEIEYGKDDNKVIYELYHDGRVINKTKNQSYCIVTDRSDYPIADLIAIKYAWLIYNNKKTEKVANKTTLGGIHSTNAGYTDFIRDMERRGWGRQQVTIPGYGEYVDYVSSTGWRREQITLNEQNTNFVSLYNVQKDATGKIIDISCPTGMKMSLMGLQQVPAGGNPAVAYPLRLNITDDNGNEISPFTRMRITKVKPSDYVIQLARIFYADVNENITNGRKKRYEELYRFHHGIEINGDEHIEIFLVNSDTHISSENIKLKIDFDFWNRASI